MLLLLWLEEEEEDEVVECGGGNGKVNPVINWDFAAIVLQRKRNPFRLIASKNLFSFSG